MNAEPQAQQPPAWSVRDQGLFALYQLALWCTVHLLDDAALLAFALS